MPTAIEKLKQKAGVPRLKHGGGNAVVGAGTGGGGAIGNTPHEKTPALAAKVEVLAALGNSREAIALACDMSIDTVDKYYRLELEQGLMQLNSRVGASIISSALGEREPCPECDGVPVDDDGTICPKCKGTGEGRGWIREPNTTAQIWWSKNRMGWSDRERIEHVGADGGPIITEQRSSAATIKSRLEQIRGRLNRPDAKDPE